MLQQRAAAVIALAVGLGPASADAQGGHWGRLGSLRTGLGELSQGLTISLAQGIRYDSNVVRTANDVETQALYGRSDASDWVSQTGVNIKYNLRGGRSTLTFAGDVGYAKYFEFDEFSGWVAGGFGSWTWNFTNRCASTVDARVERSLANFADISSSENTFQTTLNGGVDVSCFILERLRLNAGVFATEVTNDKGAFKLNNLRTTGYDASLAVVSAKKNELGIHYRSSVSKRPNAPLIEDFQYEQFDVYGVLNVGNTFRLFASTGVETSERDTGDEFDRGSAIVTLDWNPSHRAWTRLAYERVIEDAPDLVGTSRRIDRVSFDLGWNVADRVSLGGYANYQENTLDSGVAGPLTGVKEEDRVAGIFLRHNLFQLARVEWTAGYSRRDSDIPLREFESATAGVSIGIAI